MSTAWVKSSESVELRYVESGKPKLLPKPQNWLQQGLARINTKKRIKRYGTCSESLEDDSRFFLHQVSLYFGDRTEILSAAQLKCKPKSGTFSRSLMLIGLKFGKQWNLFEIVNEFLALKQLVPVNLPKGSKLSVKCIFCEIESLNVKVSW